MTKSQYNFMNIFANNIKKSIRESSKKNVPPALVLSEINAAKNLHKNCIIPGYLYVMGEAV